MVGWLTPNPWPVKIRSSVPSLGAPVHQPLVARLADNAWHPRLVKVCDRYLVEQLVILFERKKLINIFCMHSILSTYITKSIGI